MTRPPPSAAQTLAGDQHAVHTDRRLWPFTARFSLLWTFGLLIGLLLLVSVLRAFSPWPSDRYEKEVLTAILILSLLPLILPFIDLFMDRGGSVAYGSLKIDFGQVRAAQGTSVSVPVNIGTRGQAINDSSGMQIESALRDATAADLVLIDLEDGQAWWESRLLVLLAGATRRRRPERFVFVAKEGGRAQVFQGWAFAAELLTLLTRSQTAYRIAIERARAATLQLESQDRAIALPPTAPPAVGWPTPQSPLVWSVNRNHPELDGGEEVRDEKLLLEALQQQLTPEELSRAISPTRLVELFAPVLRRKAIDELWPNAQQTSSFFLRR